MLVQLEEHLAGKCKIVLTWLFLFFFVRDVITVTGRSAALDDLSIVALLTPPAPLICSRTSPAHLSSCNQRGGLQPEGSALSSPLVFKKSQTRVFSSPFLSCHPPPNPLYC